MSPSRRLSARKSTASIQVACDCLRSRKHCTQSSPRYCHLVRYFMAYREFTDERGREWTVWDVHPRLAERRLQNAGPPPGVRERRRFVERRLRLRSKMSAGWLVFEARDGERRRLAPIPDVPRAWSEASDHEFRAWCAMADPAPPARRLIE